MSSLLPVVRYDTGRQRLALQQHSRVREVTQSRRGDGGPSQFGGNTSNAGSIAIRIATSRRSIGIADLLQAAQTAFAGGEFQPEAFSRTLCLLVDALEGYDNSLRLYAARLLGRFRPYLASSPLSVEIVQRIAAVLGHGDPTARELALDALAVMAFAVGGLPPAILRGVARSFRSAFLAEREAAARAYASCLYLHRLCDADRPTGQPSSPPLLPPSSSENPELSLRSLVHMTTFASVLLPALPWGDPDWAMTGQWKSHGTNQIGASEIEAFLKPIVLKLKGDLPSQELWESSKAFILAAIAASETSEPEKPSEQARHVVVVRKHASSDQAAKQAADKKRGANDLAKHVLDVILACLVGPSPSTRSCSLPAVRSAAVDFTVAMLKAEHTGDPPLRAKGYSPLQSLLDALDAAESEAGSVEILSVLAMPAVADASFMAATVTKRRKVRITPLSLTYATLKKLWDISSSSSSSSSSKLGMCSSRVSLAASLALVSFAAASHRALNVAKKERPELQSKLSIQVNFATSHAFLCPPVADVCPGEQATGGGDHATALFDARIVLSKLRTFADEHPSRRRRVALGVARRLSRAAAGDVLAVDLAVLLSRVMKTEMETGTEAETGASGTVNSPAALLWSLLLGRRFSRRNPKAVVGIAVALMRSFQGSLRRQSALSVELVKAMGGSGDDDDRVRSGDDGDSRSSTAEAVSFKPLVVDPWFQFLLCRECMLHGFYKAAEAGLKRLREGPAAACDTALGWTEVLLRVSTAEAFYSRSTDQVAAYACAAHETRLAVESLSLFTRPGLRRRPARAGHEEDTSAPASATFHPTDDMSFQRSFLEARAELLQLLGASWAMCQEISAAAKGRYARYSRREARSRRLPAAFRRVARDFRVLRSMRPGAGPTTSEPLRAASCLCLVLAIAADALLNQGKSLQVGARDKSGTRKKTWRSWLEPLAERWEEDEDGEETTTVAPQEGVLMRTVRILGARLLELGSPQVAQIGRPAFMTMLETIRSIPFPIPRNFFRSGGSPRLSMFALRPPPHNNVALPDMWGMQDMGDLSIQSQVITGKRHRDGSISGPRYHGPSCHMRAEIVEAELMRSPPLPLLGPTSPGPQERGHGSVNPVNDSDSAVNIAVGRDPWMPLEVWWAQLAKEEAFMPEARGRHRAYGRGGWRGHAPPTPAQPGLWLLQGMVRRGRGASGALPRVSEVVLEIHLKLPPSSEKATGQDAPDATAGIALGNDGAPVPWTTKVVADIFGAEADQTTALCFRAEVLFPSMQGVREVRVVVFLRRSNASVSNFGEAMTPTLPDKANRSTRTLRTSGHEELWRVGSLSVPVPSAPMW